MKKQRGITLIALVITIIVLLILAGVSLSLTLGTNGILSQAKNGVEKHRTSSEEELILLGFNAYQTAKLTGQNPSKPDIEGANVTEDGEDGWIVDFATTGKSYKLSKNGTIEEDKPFDPVEWDKTASDEDCFVWASDDPNSEDYGKIVGYTQKAYNNTLLRYPSRTTKITFDYNNYQERFNGISVETARSYTNNILKVDIPGTVVELDDAFQNRLHIFFNSLEEVNIEEGITTIGKNAFENCINLKRVSIPKSVTKIEDSAFCDCKNLENITIPDGVTSIGGSAFNNCSSLKGINIPDGVTNLDWYICSNCSNLVEVTIGKGISEILNGRFNGCSNIEKLTIMGDFSSITEDFMQTKWYQNQPNGIVYINKVLYRYKGEMSENANIVIKEGITKICNNAFDYCENMTSVVIPDSVTEIGNCAFGHCENLTTIRIPNSVKRIGGSAFVMSKKITNIVIPESVEYIGAYTFTSWESSQNIKIKATEKPVGWDNDWDRNGHGGKINANIVWGYTGD